MGDDEVESDSQGIEHRKNVYVPASVFEPEGGGVIEVSDDFPYPSDVDPEHQH
jgi:hypothetical protein